MGLDRCLIVKQYLYWPKFLQVIFYYCSYILAAQLITGVFHLDISFSCRFRGIRIPFYVFWCLFSFYQAHWRTRRLWIKSSELKKLEEETRTQETPQHLGIFGSHYNSLMGSITRQNHWIITRTGCYGCRNFQTWDYFPELPNYQDFWGISLD
jgi:hypothetical protein